MNVPALLQTDPRWRAQRLGTNNAVTIGSDGCAITCVTMKNCYYGGTEGLVNIVDDIFTNEGAYVDSAGHRSPAAGCSELDWSQIHRCLPHTEHVATGYYANIAADLGRIKASIDAGHPVTLEVRWEGHANAMHFVEAIGYNGNDIIVNCPELGANVPFSGKHYGTGDSAKDIINAHFFTGTLPAPPAPAPAAAAAPAPAPAAAPTNPEEVNMTADQEKQAYEIVLGREPEDPSNLGRRTAMEFILDAKGELTQQRAVAAQNASELGAAQQTIQKQGDTITTLTTELQGAVPEYVHTFADGPVRDVLTQKAVTVQDFSGEHIPTPLPANTIVEVRGQFFVAGVAYFRTAKSVAGGYYYGVPASDVSDYVAPKPAVSTLDASQSAHAAVADTLNWWDKLLGKKGGSK